MIEHDRSGPVEMLTWTFSRIVMWGPAYIVAIILYEVVMRYMFANATLWVSEMSLWVGGFIFLSAGLYSMQQRSHIRIFILYDVAPLWLKRTFDVAANLCIAIFCTAVIYGVFTKTKTIFLTWELFGSAFNPPIPATTKPLILVVMLILTLQAISNLIRDWPAKPIVRQVFDVIASVIIVTGALIGLYYMVINQPEQFAIPITWQVAINTMLVAAIGLTLYGLINDFNKTPTPFEEVDQETEAHELKKNLQT